MSIRSLLMSALAVSLATATRAAIAQESPPGDQPARNLTKALTDTSAKPTSGELCLLAALKECGQSPEILRTPYMGEGSLSYFEKAADPDNRRVAFPQPGEGR